MALLYLLGQGVTQNNAMGAFYLKKAADKGNAWAMYHLGRLYYYGEGIPRNPKLALDYLQTVSYTHLTLPTNSRV